MFWKILNIEPTTDRKAIRSAYMQLLSQTNPEDKPEEFKQLREAYEQALAYAEEHQENREKTPVELWEEKLSALDDDFQKRIRVENWQKLLNEKIKIVGKVTICFLSHVSDGTYTFITNGTTPAKSPIGMFAETEVDNDLKAIDAVIRDYYGLQGLADKPKGGDE